MLNQLTDTYVCHPASMKYSTFSFMKIISHFRWLGPNVWWEISQIWIEYIKPIGQMSEVFLQKCNTAKMQLKKYSPNKSAIFFRLQCIKVETLYSTIYYSKHFIELNIDKSTQYVAIGTHKRHPIPRPFGASYGVPFMSTSTEIYGVIKGFYCTWLHYLPWLRRA